MAEVPGSPGRAPYDVVANVRPKNATMIGTQCYRIYGVVTGTSSMRMNFTGAEREIPTLDAYAVERITNRALGC